MTHDAKEPRPRAAWSLIEGALFDMVRHDTHIVAGQPVKAAPDICELDGITKKPSLMTNETNPNYYGAKAGFEDYVQIEKRLGSTALLQAHAQMLNHLVWAIPSADLLVGDVELLTCLTKWQAAIGETCMEIHKALDPSGPNGGDITPEEARAIISRGLAHMKAFMNLLERVRKLAGIEQEAIA